MSDGATTSARDLKHTRDEDKELAPHNTDRHGDKRPRRDRRNSTTEAAYNLLTQQHSLTMPLDQFVGICAYLCTLLQWGLRMDSDEMDVFITSYPTYESELDAFEMQRLDNPTFRVPAYHQWFMFQRKRTENQTRVVLNEATLRAIWSEHPYTFLRAQWTLQAISTRVQRSGAKAGQSGNEGLRQQPHERP